MERFRKNPFIYDYGYHFTRDEDLNRILDNGFKIKKDSYSEPCDKLVYGNIKPIFFVTSPNYFNLYPKTVLAAFLRPRDFILKVNIKSFDQNIDLMALMDWGIYKSGPLFTIENNNLIIDHDTKSYNLNLLNSYPLIKKWFVKFNYRIPLSEFKTNQQLILDSIITTQSFTILEDISPKLIVDVIKIKK